MRASIVLALSLIAPAAAQANLRAPFEILQPPSSALAPPPASPASSGPAPRVLAESLDLQGGAPGAPYQVRATYRVHAERAADYALSFVLPGPAVVQAIVNDAPPQTVASAEPPARPRPYDRRDPPPHSARFTASLRPGENRITVRYQQPVAQLEHGHSYFSKGRFVDTIRYELWPLREWPLAPDFRLDLEVRIPRPAPGFFARARHRYRMLRCQGVSRPAAPQQNPAPPEQEAVPPAPVVTPLTTQLLQEGDTLRLQAALSTTFPDTLRCHSGDADLL